MRKLVLFGLLAGVFGLALVLERFFSGRAPLPAAKAADHRVVLSLGGGAPRAIPDEPPPSKDDSRGSPLAGSGRTARPNDSSDDDSRASRPRDPPTNPSRPAARVHVVTKGETLSGIARQELGASSRWKDLARWNDIADPSSLKEGMSLRIQATDATTAAPNATAPNAVPAADPQHPAPTAGEPRTHRVAKGDTLSRIAARYLGDATRWREIQRLNAISDPASLSEGATLKIPER